MIRSENISLRAPEPTDIDLLYQWENDPEMWQVSNTLTPYSRFAIEQYVLNSANDLYSDRQLRLMIDLHKDDPPKTVGCIDLFDLDPGHRRAGIGIMIVSGERGKGFASEALDLVIAHAFGPLGLHQLYANVIAGNEKSLNLFKRKHFTLIGVKREWLRNENSWTDEYMLQLINQKHC